MTSKVTRIILLVMMAAGMVLPAQPGIAQQAPLKVVIKPLAPFVEYDGDTNIGFSIDLWREIAIRLKREFVFVRVNTVTEQLISVRNAEADVAITGISITREREELVDFSLPYFDAGLQIMVSEGRSAPSLFSMLGTFLSRNVLQIILILNGFILAVALAFFLAERRSNPDFPPGLRGLGEALWWACVTVVTVGYGDRVPRTRLGRLVAIFWMFVGLFLISNFTATITSELTLRQLQGSINSIDDLGDKRVLAIEGSTGARFLNARGLSHTTVKAADEAYARLIADAADAFVYDSPVLLHHALGAGAGKLRVVGGVFSPEHYGIAFPQKSELREEVNRVLLQIREDGTYDVIYAKYFGERRN
jgi:polar amino acid transport system substrate-binding protein